MKKNVVRVLAVIMLLVMIILPCQAADRSSLTILESTTAEEAKQTLEQPVLRLYSKSAVLMDASSGRVLYEKNGEEQLPMASTTKIMTLILTLERADLEDIVEVSAYAASMPEVKLHIRQGEQYRLKDLLYSLMLESHNDSAVAIAEYVGGSVGEFAAMMNHKAEEIGCNNTCFITPNGLDATAEFTLEDGTKATKKHSTTAKDLARILSYCITDSPCREQFLEITRTPSYSFSNVAGTRNFDCTNHNAFLSMMSGALTGKTGFTGNAGYCYAGALRREERTYVVALLACGWPNHKTYKWSDTRTLMEYGLDNYSYHDLTKEKIPQKALEPIMVENGQTQNLGENAYIDIVPKEADDMCNGILMRKDEEIEVRVEKRETFTAPVYAGMKIGEVSFYTRDGKWRSVELVAAENVDAINMNWCLIQVLKKWLT